MKRPFAFISALAIGAVLTAVSVTGALAEEKMEPKLVFPAKMGPVTFNHMLHATKHATGGCTACHTKLFAKDSKAPLEFKAGMHKPAEAAKTSCGACHNPAGPAFATANNCKKCHGNA